MQTIAEAEIALARARLAQNENEVQRIEAWIEHRRAKSREKVQRFRAKGGSSRGTPEHQLARKIERQRTQIDHWSKRAEEEPSLAEVFLARVRSAEDRLRTYESELAWLDEQREAGVPDA